MTFEEVLSELMRVSDPNYAEFIARGAATDYPILGVRVPQIQKLADKFFEKNEDISGFLVKNEPRSREEMHFYSMVLCRYAKEHEISEVKPLIFRHIERMDSWEMTDTFSSRLKCVKKNREGWLEVIDEMLQGSEFLARTGIVLMLWYFLEPEWVQVVFERILKVKDRSEYYVKMATAWTLQGAFSKFPDLTLAVLRDGGIPEWTTRKAVSKIQDSYRVDAEWKERARELLNKR